MFARKTVGTVLPLAAGLAFDAAAMLARKILLSDFQVATRDLKLIFAASRYFCEAVKDLSA